MGAVDLCLPVSATPGPSSALGLIVSLNLIAKHGRHNGLTNQSEKEQSASPQRVPGQERKTVYFLSSPYPEFLPLSSAPLHLAQPADWKSLLCQTGGQLWLPGRCWSLLVVSLSSDSRLGQVFTPLLTSWREERALQAVLATGGSLCEHTL